MLSNRLAKHFGAAAAAAVVVGSANAALVSWTNCNLVIPANIDGLYINVETRATGTTSAVAGWDINPYGSTSLSFFSATGTSMLRYPGVTTGPAGNLANGNVVDSAGSYDISTTAVTVGAAAGNWALNSVNKFGFKVLAADGFTHYGWGTFQIGASISGADRTITNLYFDDVAGAAVTVGVVPAPGALALLGLAGLAGRRRR